MTSQERAKAIEIFNTCKLDRLQYRYLKAIMVSSYDTDRQINPDMPRKFLYDMCLEQEEHYRIWNKNNHKVQTMRAMRAKDVGWYNTHFNNRNIVT